MNMLTMPSASTLRPEVGALRDHLALHYGEERFTLTAIPAEGGHPVGWSGSDHRQGARWADARNVEGHSVYLHVAGGLDTTGSRSLRKDELTRLLTVHAEFDPPPRRNGGGGKPRRLAV